MNPAIQPHPVAAAPRRSATATGLTVVIPVYDEAHRLADSLVEVLAHLRARAEDWELIVVDDGSTDDSAAIAARFAAAEPRLRLLTGTGNRGKGHAVRRGVAASRGRRVLYCDADLATPIAEADRLLAVLDSGGDAAIGSRAAATIAVPQPLTRILLGRLGNWLIRLLAVPGVRDTQCGFKALDGDLARRVFAETTVDGWAFDVELLRLLARDHRRVAEVPVRWSHRPGSKVRARDYPATLLELLRLRRRHRGVRR